MCSLLAPIVDTSARAFAGDGASPDKGKIAHNAKPAKHTGSEPTNPSMRRTSNPPERSLIMGLRQTRGRSLTKPSLRNTLAPNQ